jgi:hypothetical protein
MAKYPNPTVAYDSPFGSPFLTRAQAERLHRMGRSGATPYAPLPSPKIAADARLGRAVAQAIRCLKAPASKSRATHRANLILAKDNTMSGYTQLANEAMAEAKLNMKLIDALREYLMPILDGDQMDGFDQVWTPMLNGNNLADGDPAMPKNAMDAAIGSALGQLRTAEREVASVLGDVSGMGLNSAAELYQAALKKCGADTRGVPGHTLGAMFREVRKMRVAQDAAPAGASMVSHRVLVTTASAAAAPPAVAGKTYEERWGRSVPVKQQ